MVIMTRLAVANLEAVKKWRAPRMHDHWIGERLENAALEELVMALHATTVISIPGSAC